MREYGIVSPMFWVGETGRALRKDPNAQRVAIYLMTSPSSEMTGVYYCPLTAILNDVGSFEAPYKPLVSPSKAPLEGSTSPLEGVKQAILTLIKLDFCFYDFESEFVFVKEMARWQIGESLKEKDNRVIGLRKYVKSMPKPIAARFLERYNDDFHLGFDLDDYAEWLKGKPSPDIAPCKPLRRGYMEPLRSQEQDQEQDQEQNIFNHNKHTTEITEAIALDESLSDSFDLGIQNQIDEVGQQSAQKHLENPDYVLTPLEMIALARMYGVKLSRTQELIDLCKRKTITVDCFRRCIEIWKGQGKHTGYLIGILRNAAEDPKQYQTERYRASLTAKKQREIDEWAKSETPL